MLYHTVPVFAESNPPASSNIRALHWLVGSWIDRTGLVYSEEHWLPAKGAMMLGIHRTVAQLDERAFFEFLRIEQVGDQVIFYAGPEGQGPTPFHLVGISYQKAIFENKNHDYPSRIIYWKDKQGFLNARTEGALGNEPKSEEWRWEPLRTQSE